MYKHPSDEEKSVSNVPQVFQLNAPLTGVLSCKPTGQISTAHLSMLTKLKTGSYRTPAVAEVPNVLEGRRKTEM